MVRRRRARDNPSILGNADDVPESFARRVETAADRALAAGAVSPLTYLGTGMTADVFCDARGIGYKVAVDGPVARNMVATEAEWLATAGQVPGVREHVAAFYAYVPSLGVLIRECVPQRAYHRKNDRKIFDLHHRIWTLMRPHGWTAPEFKTESYAVVRGRGPVLFDASMPLRVGRQLAAYVADVVAGRRPEYSNESLNDLAFAVRGEVRQGTLSRSVGGRLLARLKARGATAWTDLPDVD